MSNKHIIYQIKSLNHAIMVSVSPNKRENNFMPTPTQMQIIHYLKTHDKVYQKDLCINLNLTRATLSGVLKTMEKHNLIIKIQDKEDTRINEIVLADDTLKLFDIVKENLKVTEKNLIKNINEDDLKTFEKVVNQMKDNLEGK